MQDKIMVIKLGICGIIAFLGELFDYQIKLVLLMFGMMVIDFVTGTIAGAKTVGLSSKIAREGALSKLAYFAVVGAAALCDATLTILTDNIGAAFSWPIVCTPLACGWYIITDAISILENATNMGAPVPGWMKKHLKITRDKFDDVTETEDENG